MAVAKVTTARVAASRALVARAVTSQPPVVQPPPPSASPLARQRAAYQARPAPVQPPDRRAAAPAPAPTDPPGESSRPPVRRPPPPSHAAAPPERPPAARIEPPPAEAESSFSDPQPSGQFPRIPAEPPSTVIEDDDYAPPPPSVRQFSPRPAPSGPVRVNTRTETYGDDDDAWGDAGAVGGSTAYESRPRISASPAGDWRPLTEPPKRRSGSGPPVAPPTGIDEPRSRRRKRRSRPS
jgi:hypothetical protein